VKKSKVLTLGLIVGLVVSLLFIGGCVPAEAPEGGGFDWSIILFLILIFGMFYLILIRPQRRKQKEHQRLVEELKRGDRVITAGGIYGQIESVSDDSVVIKIESGVTMKVARNSVTLKQER